MNQLQHETSPYLLQHAGNPVNWYAWKPEAFEKAKKEDKPILVSIGYSTCHWCHVMERESFEDEEVATFMNDHFVCIKVDREERPDVDQIYMEACQVLTGGGGWPLNCFLTPDGRPFHAGTYYPPMPAYNRPSWLQVLMKISHAYQNQRQTVEDQADRLTEIIENSGKTFTGNPPVLTDGEQPSFGPTLAQGMFAALEKQFDTRYGGFGGAPKFPGSMSLEFLLAYHFYTGEKAALDHVALSLDRMIMGGIYDQIGGGFARYSTDVAWLVPHFEKMLYDNALLVGLLSDAYKTTGNELYRNTIVETLEWVRREMTGSDGGFFSALDADSEGEEGKFYVWDKAAVDGILGKDAAIFCEFYDVTEKGNWEGKNILWRRKSLESFAQEKGMSAHELANRLGQARQQLFEEREKRIRPGLDDKVMLDWNALMCSAYAKAYSALGDEAYKKAAVDNLAFLLKNMARPDGEGLYHTYKAGKAQYDAFLDDYAFLIEAMLDVAEITGNPEYILQSGRYIEFVLENFFDVTDKMFYFTSAKQKDVLLRKKDLYDSATPSGNSTMVRNLQRAGILLGREDWRHLAGQSLLVMRDAIVRYPGSFARWANSLLGEVFGIPEIAVVGSQAAGLAASVNREYLPQKALMSSEVPDDSYPLLEGKTSDDDTYIYICRNYACQAPVRTIEAFRQSVRHR